jgi:uncharacterized membrane protein YebE (DUF533 family)
MADHLLETLFVMCAVDGKIDESEQQLIDALRGTVPGLRGRPAPERVSRKELLERLQTVDALADRRQIYVLALEVGYASGHLNESEQKYLHHIQTALRLDDDFVARAREIIGAKYKG